MQSNEYQHILSFNLCNHNDQIGIFHGRVYNKRDIKKIVFLVIKDREGYLQIIFKGNETSMTDNIKIGDYVYITGQITYSKENDKHEIIAPKIVHVYPSTSAPFDYFKDQTSLDIDTLLQHRAISIRRPIAIEINRLLQEVMKETRKFFENKVRSHEILFPCISHAGGEGGANTFLIKYFDSHAFLSQSGQLYKQIAVGALGSVFGISSCFRAEHSHTSHHLTESRQIEFESILNTPKNLEDIITVINDLIIHIIRHLHEDPHWQKNTSIKNIKLPARIPRLTFYEAIELCNETAGDKQHSDEDMTREMEVKLCKISAEEHESDFVVITHYPTKLRPFYSLPDLYNKKLTLTFDLLFRGLEIASGGLRIHDHAELLDAIQSNGLNPDQFTTYLETFKHGIAPHGGFGLGLERLVMQLFSVSNIREIPLFPSDCFRITGQKLV